MMINSSLSLYSDTNVIVLKVLSYLILDSTSSDEFTFDNLISWFLVYKFYV